MWLHRNVFPWLAKVMTGVLVNLSSDPFFLVVGFSLEYQWSPRLKRAPVLFVAPDLGVFCNSAIKSAERDMKAKLEDRHDFRALMMNIFKQIDASGDGKLTLTEFETLFDSEAMKALLETADIKAADAWGLFDSLDRDGDSLVDVNEFIEQCLELHGPARALDLHTLTRQTMKFAEQLAAIEKAQQQQLRFTTFPAQNKSAPQDDTFICM